MKRVLFLVLPLALLAASGCGSSDASAPVDKTNLPGSALDCLEANNIPARQTGENGDELVLDAGPKIVFYLTADEAIAEQFRGRGEGAEQIGTRAPVRAEGDQQAERRPPARRRGLPRDLSRA